MNRKPIPAFYCCYLLRSIENHSVLYVGSTPHPLRRLAQHNGDTKGGAVRTARDNLRPWEMTCIVSGYPSKIAALQFEWAWHNSHLTKKIAARERITPVISKPHKSSKSGRTRNRPSQSSRPSLKNKLQNLHLLLRVPSFARWPLQVRFCSEDVYRAWQRWNASVDGTIRSSINTILDFKQLVEGAEDNNAPKSTQAKSKRKQEPLHLDVGYKSFKPHVEKSLSLLTKDQRLSCAVCTTELGLGTQTIVVCPKGDCRTVSHMTCLAKRFLDEERSDALVLPTSGACPGCRSEIQWTDLVKEMSLRLRGEKELIQMMKEPRSRKRRTATGQEAMILDSAKIDEEIVADEAVVDADDDSLPDGWQYQEGDDDMVSVTSTMSIASEITDPPTTTDYNPPKRHLKAVIEDSEWDEADVLD